MSGDVRATAEHWEIYDHRAWQSGHSDMDSVPLHNILVLNSAATHPDIVLSQ